jgi:hypothetical protein
MAPQFLLMGNFKLTKYMRALGKAEMKFSFDGLSIMQLSGVHLILYR